MNTLEHAPPVSPGAVRVADEMLHVVKAYQRMRQQLQTQNSAEWSAQIILRCLAHEGALRAGAVAERIDSDPSTVSRQVAALVRDGLVERRADPQDGRASLLVLTEQAQDVIAEHEARRHQRFGEMLARWDEADLITFATLLERFATDFESVRFSWPAASTNSAVTPEGI